MRPVLKLVLIGLSGLSLAPVVGAQAPKSGLYEVTNRMTWQHSPFPDGMQEPSGSGGPHIAKTCLTQEQIDKYNGPKPEANGGCQVTNIRKHENRMTAEMSCSGSMKGNGTVETVWTDSGHSKSKVHFTGQMQIGTQSKAIEWTVDSEARYTGPDCGSVKPSAE